MTFGNIDLTHSLTSSCFSENQPFFTEKLEKLKRRKCREFSENRKSKKFLDIQTIYRKELLDAKKVYYRKKNPCPEK